MITFHYLSRALVRDGDYVLLVRAKGTRNTFLPGGHVESGEPAKKAVVREIYEETGLNAEVLGFCGAVEHMWPAESKANHEIDLVFSVHIHGLDKDNSPSSREEHLEFFWADISTLNAHNLQPSPLIDLIEKNGNTNCFWGSSVERGE